MSLDEIIQLLIAYKWEIGVLVLTMVQIAPIKIDPWTWLAKKIVSLINGDVLRKMQDLEDRMDKMEKNQANLEKKQDESKAVFARVRILRFGDELQEGKRHSKEHFNQILEDINDYENYCVKNPDFKNGITPDTIKYIEEVHMDKLRNHSF